MSNKHLTNGMPTVLVEGTQRRLSGFPLMYFLLDAGKDVVKCWISLYHRSRIIRPFDADH